MHSSERVAATLMAMDKASASAMVPALRALLEEQWAACDVQLLVADYRFRVLQPVEQPNTPVPVDGTAPGRAFRSQQPDLGPAGDRGVPVRLPVTVRGERLGVLQLSLPAAPGAEQQRELAELATAVGYALVAAGKETDLYRRAARTQRLSLAAELQWQLLPAHAVAAAEFTLAGQLEPAYQVGGDNFDWSCSADSLQLSVCDGNGLGAPAALLTTLAVTALRNARRAGLSLTDQACLTDQALYANHTGRRFLQMLLLQVDLATGRMQAVDAGSPLLLRLRHSHVEHLELDAQLPLGMFDGTNYTAQEIQLEPGDRLVIVSDGVHTARSPHDDEFGAVKLDHAILATRTHSPGESVRSLIGELLAHHEGGELHDDAVVVCLDWTGPHPAARTSGNPPAEPRNAPR